MPIQKNCKFLYLKMKKKYPMSEFTGLHLILNYPSPSVDSSENVKKETKNSLSLLFIIFLMHSIVLW